MMAGKDELGFDPSQPLNGLCLNASRKIYLAILELNEKKQMILYKEGSGQTRKFSRAGKALMLLLAEQTRVEAAEDECDGEEFAEFMHACDLVLRVLERPIP